MTSTTIECDRQHPTLTVADVVAAAESTPGSSASASASPGESRRQMAGVTLDRVQVFLSKGQPNPEGCSVYFVVGDADELFDSTGRAESSRRADRRPRLRDARLLCERSRRQPARLRSPHLLGRAGIPIERVDLPVRLEKRLAAALIDLAAWKRMSLTSCLEETLLHTFEPLGDGVASPHTQRDLRYIQELRRSTASTTTRTASYRFVEGAK